jgi:leader peptidase (prepilin peptidase)/N-methyltransferase
MTPAWLPGTPLVWGFLIALGLCLGSFLNVVIYRLPLGQSLIRPGSHCPLCNHRIAPYDNVPVLSFLLLRGRCRHCKGGISFRYPAVEIVAAACVLLGVLSSASLIGAVARSLFLLSMLAVTLIDLDHRIIPDEISLPGIVLGILACPYLQVPRLDGVIGAVAGGGALLAVALGYRAIRGIEGMGMGDVKLAAMVGAFLGWKGVLLTLIIGSLLGSLLGIALMGLRRADGRTALPYGTFLAPAAALVLLVGPRVWAWYGTLLHPSGSGTW